MTNKEITFHNKTEINTLAQIFSGTTLVSTQLAKPGESCTLTYDSTEYDIYFKNGATGWEIARKLGIDADKLTLMKESNGWYVITAA